MNRRKAIQQTAILLGGAVSASIVSGVMSGCQPTGAIDWSPQFLSKEEAKIIGELAETILPETDTPGAKSMHLDEFIDLMLKDCFTGAEQLQFKKGLANLDEACKISTGQSLLKCSPDERQVFLIEQEKKGLATRMKTGEKAFVTTLKELVLTGYFTSEYAINELMDYRPNPQKMEGCLETPQKIQVGIEGRSA